MDRDAYELEVKTGSVVIAGDVYGILGMLHDMTEYCLQNAVDLNENLKRIYGVPDLDAAPMIKNLDRFLEKIHSVMEQIITSKERPDGEQETPC